MFAVVVGLFGCGDDDVAPVGDAGPHDAAVPDAGASDAGPVADAGAALDALLLRLRAPTATAAELDAALVEQGLAGGWPLADAERLVFLTRWDEAVGTVALVSDLDAWSTTARPAERLASGVHYLVVIERAALTVPLPGAKYKWWNAPAVYRAPPEATAYGYDTNGEHGYVAPPTDAAWYERFPGFASAHLATPRTLRARLPAGFVPGSAAAATARSVLFHDGQNVFDPNAAYGGWHAGDALADAAYADVVALAVDNASDRFAAYTHVTDDIGTGGIEGGRAADYLALLDDEALPFFRARYGVHALGDDLVLAGSSLGGLVSLYAAMTSDTRQGCVIAMSSTVGWGSIDPAAVDGRTLIDLWPARGHGTTSVYLDSGGSAGSGCVDSDADGIQDDTADALDNYCESAQLRDLLATLGYAFDVDLAHWHEPGAAHDEAAWAARLPRGLAACAAMGWSPSP
jgi:hypothetical protein